MFYFFDQKDGSIWAYDHKEQAKNGLSPITEAEVKVILARPPAQTPEQVLEAQVSKLQNENQQSASQKALLSNRIGVIQDAIDLQMATKAEKDELPVRQEQLLAWKKYAILLGRVSSQAKWPSVVEWPEKPTSGIDLSTPVVA